MTSTTPWWRDAVIYQVYVRSYADSDGDGVGDLAGVRARLPYIARLGVDAIWLNPFYPSPQADGGYDVADYRDVDPVFGTLATFDRLLGDAHDLGLRVIIDLVPNHTSDRHVWFRAALDAGPGSAERARYLFRPGRGPDTASSAASPPGPAGPDTASSAASPPGPAGPDGRDPPNDWLSVFGGSAWTRVPDGQWYLHLFAPEQPDLDWTNEEVRREFDDILRFWLDRGVDGFRIDVAHGLAKDPAMPDLAGNYGPSGPAKEGHPYWDQDEVHEVYRRWRRITDSYPGDVTFVGEAWVDSPSRLARYLRPDELHTAFNFNFLLAPWDASALRRAIDESIEALEAVGAPPTWVLSNHDVVRHVTRYGGGDLGRRRARAAALLMLALPGGAYVYQGEELGLPQVTDLPDSALRDPTFFRTGGAERGRDGCRVPIPWSGDAPPFGFGRDKAWLPQPPVWADLTVERQESDAASMLTLYRDALRLRKRVNQSAPLEWIDAADDVLAFRRGPDFACAINLADEPAEVPTAVAGDDVVLASGPIEQRGLPGATAVWLGSLKAT